MGGWEDAVEIAQEQVGWSCRVHRMVGGTEDWGLYTAGLGVRIKGQGLRRDGAMESESATVR